MTTSRRAKSDSTGYPTLPREIARGVFWFTSCLDISVQGTPLHNHNSCFLVVGDLHTALIDTAVPFGWERLRDELIRVLDGRSLDYIIPTHPESPHMGNSEALLELYPKARLAGDLRNYELYVPDFQDRFQHLTVGQRINLGDRDLVMVQAAVHDLPNTLWIYETQNKVLFVSDGYPYTHAHLEHQCGMFSHEIGEDLGTASMMVVIEGALGWTRYVPADHTIRILDEILEEYPPHIIAPAHGGVITNPEKMTEIFRAGLREVSRFAK